MQREKEYEEARRRIYGESTPSAPKDDPLAKGIRDLSLGPGSRSGSSAGRPRSGTGGSGRSQKEKGSGSRGSSNASLGAGEKVGPADVVRTPRGPGDGQVGFGSDSGRSRGGKTVG